MFSYHIQELTGALEQLESLRKSLDYLRATTARSELAETVREFQGKASILQQELEDSIAAHSGHLLACIAEDMETAEVVRGQGNEDIICTLGELRRIGEAQLSIVLDRDLRVLHKIWGESRLPEELHSRLGEEKLVSNFGLQVAAVLIKYYEKIKIHMECHRFA